MYANTHQIPGPRIGAETIETPHVGVMDLYGGELVEQDRILYPAGAENARLAESTLLSMLAAAKMEGSHIAIVDGAFDVPHDNHTWYLREARMRAAKDTYGEAFQGASRQEQQAMVASASILLLVTLDADDKIAEKKGFRADKGNVARPVYTWDARANRIGGHMIPDGNGAYKPVIDLVTVEGDYSHTGTMFESHLKFGESLVQSGLLDTWVLFDEHGATIQEAENIAGVQAERVLSVVPQDEARFANDPRTGTYWSSSRIIERIVGSV